MTVHAIFEDGVFKPTEPVSLPNGSKVEFEPRTAEEATEKVETALEREIRWFISRTPEEIAEDRRRILASGRPARPLPPGKTLADVVQGTWPGDETEEEIREALERLS